MKSGSPQSHPGSGEAGRGGAREGAASFLRRGGNRSRILPGALAVLLSLFALALLLDGGDSDRAEPSKPHRVVPGRSQLEGYEILRRTEGSRIPAGLKAALLTALDGRPAGLEFDRAVPVSTPEGRLWMVAGADITCIVQEEEKALSCDASDAVVEDGLVIGVFEPPRRPGERPTNFLVLGVVPDPVERVRLKVGERRRTIPVWGNAYSVRADRPITVEGFELD